MKSPTELSSESEKYLRNLSFELIKSEENSWAKSFLWANDILNFGIEYDRLYYDCYIMAHTKPIEHLYLVKLLRLLNNDLDFYKQELITANVMYTLPINQYIKLFFDNYNMIKSFMIGYDIVKFSEYDKFEDRYEGI